MEYSRFSAHQFANDPLFQSWVLHSTAEDDALWQNWLHEHPHKKEEVEQARRLLLGWRFEEPDVSPEEIASLKGRILQSWHHHEQPEVRQPIPMWRSPRVAASVAVLLAFTASLFWLFNADDEWTTYKTAFGEIRTVQLPDGSEVTLNANSTLRFAEDWTAPESREVWLQGEAFFKVVRQPLARQEETYRKFSVHADQLKVQVIGTQFNIYNRGAKTEVVLEEGVVEVSLSQDDSQAAEPLRMLPGEKITYQQQEISQQKVDPLTHTSWKESRLVFDAVPLSQVASVIEETYGVEVHFADSTLSGQVFTGTVPSSQLDILLNALSGIYQLDIRRQNDKIIIDRK